MNMDRLTRRVRAVEKRAAAAVPDRLTDAKIIIAISSREFDGHVLDDLYDVIKDNFKVTIQVFAFLTRLARVEYGANDSPGHSVDILTHALGWFPNEQCSPEARSMVDRMSSPGKKTFVPLKGIPPAVDARYYLCERLLAQWSFSELQEEVVEWWAKPEAVVVSRVSPERALRLLKLTEGLDIPLDGPLIHWPAEDATLVDIAGQCRTERRRRLQNTEGRAYGGPIRSVPDPEGSVPSILRAEP